MSSIKTLADVQREMGDEVTERALNELRDYDDHDYAVAEMTRKRAAGDPDGIFGVALAMLVRGIVDIENIPDLGLDDDDDEIVQGEVVEAVAQVPDEVVFPRSLGATWKLQAALRLSKSDTNGLEILQIAVTEFLLGNGISEPGLQEQYDAQQEALKE